MSRISLTVRLNLLFALILIACFSVVGFILFGALSREIYAQNDMSIVLAGRHLRRLAGEMDSTQAVREYQARLISLVLGDANLALRVQTSRHQPLIDYNPPHLDIIELPEVSADERIVPAQLLHWQSSGDIPVRGVATYARLRDGTQISIAVARSMQDRSAMLARYQTLIWVTEGTTILVAVLVGFLFIRRALRPLREIASNARAITTERLDAQIHIQQAPAEFHALVSSLNTMLERLERGFSRMWEFTTDLAHDLRTPVATIRGTSEVTLSRERPPAEYQTQLASTIEECDRLARMIENVLFLARAESPTFALSRIAFQASEELHRIADYFEGLAEEQNIRIRVEGEADLEADRDLFRRAVGNLLSNALRHTALGSTIVLSAAMTATESIITVANPGPGISREHLPRLFDRFFRGDPARSLGGSSSGLGLAIVKTILELHGGYATVDSQPNAVTAFRLHFPRA